MKLDRDRMRHENQSNGSQSMPPPIWFNKAKKQGPKDSRRDKKADDDSDPTKYVSWDF